MIKSNKDLVDSIGNGINNAASVCQMGAAKQVPDTDFEIQTQCEEGYKKSSESLKSLQSFIAENVGVMQHIAANFDDVDEQLANQLRG